MHVEHRRTVGWLQRRPQRREASHRWVGHLRVEHQQRRVNPGEASSWARQLILRRGTVAYLKIQDPQRREASHRWVRHISTVMNTNRQDAWLMVTSGRHYGGEQSCISGLCVGRLQRRPQRREARDGWVGHLRVEHQQRRVNPGEASSRARQLILRRRTIAHLEIRGP